MGARFRLKASVDISSLNPQYKVVAQGLKDYGLIVADNGSAFFMTGASYSVDTSNHFALTWNDNDIQDTAHGLKSLLFTNFEVVNLSPAITSLSPTQAVAGTSVTITGRNFSGAAGGLSVWFGTNQAQATPTDDAHVPEQLAGIRCGNDSDQRQFSAQNHQCAGGFRTATGAIPPAVRRSAAGAYPAVTVRTPPAPA